MPPAILVTYASRGGSTAGVAEAIGADLREHGSQVSVQPIHAVNDLHAYDALVMGSAVQAGQLLPEAMQFAQAHQAELAQKPLAAFLVCMTMSMKPAIFRGAAKNFFTPLHTLVTPVSESCFAGVVDFAQMPPEMRDDRFMRLCIRLGIFTEGDHRDWPAIHAWAKSLPPKLGLPLQARARGLVS